ncbi:queuosine precursor transporter [Pseudenhygromyxa sp. WMMC2535]|uniref:queuosine precursor transporter n=1 Tax=Pseudenhygromyxa sp. WMMC2535 TaxID=2712867 RepID=UPI0015525594|nr:queuosine precursor transporter [Pseudenhygromyxa sp. WMMC2535]NVB42195.1 queuosine precursor transporter [Pseudenhygromyxa sp. WMMC2535]
MSEEASDPQPQPTPWLRGGSYEQTYLILAGLFIAALVACNLIFQKFFTVEIPLPWGGSRTLSQSVGIIAYPLTFLVTDILSEIYGAKRANQVVVAGLVASVFTTVLVELADIAPSAPFGIGDETFHQVFGLSKVAVFASMAAYLTAQFIDIRLFHFWRKLTHGKHLWLRNNGSTIASQLVDTFVVLALLASFGAAGITWEVVPRLFLDGLIFKWTFAALDTPLFYLAVYVLERRFPEQVAALREDEG